MPNRLDPLGANASDPGILTSDGRGAERQAFIQVCLARYNARQFIARIDIP